MSYLYLASPYTHPNPLMRQFRYEAVRDFAAHLMQERTWVHCPIVQTHDMSMFHKLPYEFDYWQDWNRSMIYPSTGVVIFQIEGWNTSVGVSAEIEYAQAIGRPVVYSKVTWPDYQHPDNPVL